MKYPKVAEIKTLLALSGTNYKIDSEYFYTRPFELGEIRYWVIIDGRNSGARFLTNRAAWRWAYQHRYGKAEPA